MICRKSFVHRPKPPESDPKPRDESNYAAFLKDMQRYPVLPKTEARALLARAQVGDVEAGRKLCSHNLRFILAVAMRFRGNGLPLLDLVNEGARGFMRAIAYFQDGHNAQLNSYAVWWIRSFITRAINLTGRGVRIPANHEMPLRESWRNPLHQIVGGTYIEDVSQLKSIRSGLVNAKSIRKTLDVVNGSISLDHPLDENKGTISDLLQSDTEAPDERMIRKEQENQVQALLKKLNPRDREVIVELFGFRDGESKVLQDVADKIGVSKERVRQIRDKALRKMRGGVT